MVGVCLRRRDSGAPQERKRHRCASAAGPSRRGDARASRVRRGVRGVRARGVEGEAEGARAGETGVVLAEKRRPVGDEAVAAAARRRRRARARRDREKVTRQRLRVVPRARARAGAARARGRGRVERRGGRTRRRDLRGELDVGLVRLEKRRGCRRERRRIRTRRRRRVERDGHVRGGLVEPPARLRRRGPRGSRGRCVRLGGRRRRRLGVLRRGGRRVRRVCRRRDCLRQFTREKHASATRRGAPRRPGGFRRRVARVRRRAGGPPRGGGRHGRGRERREDGPRRGRGLKRRRRRGRGVIRAARVRSGGVRGRAALARRRGRRVLRRRRGRHRGHGRRRE